MFLHSVFRSIPGLFLSFQPPIVNAVTIKFAFKSWTLVLEATALLTKTQVYFLAPINLLVYLPIPISRADISDRQVYFRQRLQ